MTYKSLLKYGEKEARKQGLEETAIKNLLLHISNKSATELYISLDQEATQEEIDTFKKLLEQYTIEKKPIQYIIGFAYFYGYKILVNEDTLIPRWETEELANNILIYYDRLFKGQKVDVVDLGTGSGAIAIALDKEEPNMNVFATDISKEAIDLAKQSAKLNDAHITFSVGSWFEALDGNTKFDIIVSNPPYLMNQEHVEDIVKNNEPNIALYGGDDGLVFYREILKNAKKYLKKDKYIIGFEHGYQSKDALNSIIKEYFPLDKIVNLKDSNNLDRMTFIIKE